MTDDGFGLHEALGSDFLIAACLVYHRSVALAIACVTCQVKQSGTLMMSLVPHETCWIVGLWTVLAATRRGHPIRKPPQALPPAGSQPGYSAAARSSKECEPSSPLLLKRPMSLPCPLRQELRRHKKTGSTTKAGEQRLRLNWRATSWQAASASFRQHIAAVDQVQLDCAASTAAGQRILPPEYSHQALSIKHRLWEAKDVGLRLAVATSSKHGSFGLPQGPSP
ncbi:hypothetical protein O181_023319 [Austropuccinia psidii MF-1]|uniref:Uncharacterized protein n=1 Tax=Austropuccinia psidii MF-1 TaxID=1389203 RepID=A0A9Q3CGG0_9BASI|nr:hypothetical protein [Austropuccinia psidii MF-1]